MRQHACCFSQEALNSKKAAVCCCIQHLYGEVTNCIVTFFFFIGCRLNSSQFMNNKVIIKGYLCSKKFLTLSESAVWLKYSTKCWLLSVWQNFVPNNQVRFVWNYLTVRKYPLPGCILDELMHTIAWYLFDESSCLSLHSAPLWWSNKLYCDLFFLYWVSPQFLIIHE